MGVEYCGAFPSEVARMGMSKDEEDKLLWTRAKNEIFSVIALYKALELGSQAAFPPSIILNSWVPPKVGFFAWEAT